MLALENVDVFHGRIHAVRRVSLHVDPGEIVALIGANGAGKTTLLGAVSGLVRVGAGRIVHDGRDIHTLAPDAIVRRASPSPGTPPGLRALKRRGQPSAWGLHPARPLPPGRCGRRPGGRLRHVPGPARPQETGRRDPVRGRAADAGHRPGAHGQTRGASARRARHGPCAHRVPGDIQTHREASRRAGPDRAPGGTKRQERPGRGRPGLRFWRPGASCPGDLGGTVGQPRRAAGLSGQGKENP